jgi:UPF0288 family protein (methanogenesis marker protein 3)
MGGVYFKEFMKTLTARQLTRNGSMIYSYLGENPMGTILVQNQREPKKSFIVLSREKYNSLCGVPREEIASLVDMRKELVRKIRRNYKTKSLMASKKRESVASLAPAVCLYD